ncbi:hypothetical protein CEP53_000056 [Fusarium sp. AF-6]|nr:hypothetical protein CEP53_000056 [Fusarium sp. AF-6]
MHTPLTPRHQDAKSSSSPDEQSTAAPSLHAPVANAYGNSLDRLYPGSKFLAMGRKISASASIFKPYYSPSPPVQPPVSSRPNPFNAPPPSSLSTKPVPPASSSPECLGQKASDTVSIPCDGHQSAGPYLTPSGESRSHPASTDQLTQNDKIIEQKDDLGSEPSVFFGPRIPRRRTRRVRCMGLTDDMEKLQRLLENATQQLDQVIYIARHVTENITESIVADETYSWKTALVRDFKAYRETQLLWETEDRMEDLLGLRHNLTVIESALEILFEEQRNIIYQ